MERKQRKRQPMNRRQKLQQNVSIGRISLLVILAVSLLNQLLLLVGVKYFFLFGASIPYYLNWLGQALSEYYHVTGYKVVALLIALALFAAYAISWMLSAKHWKWMRLGLILYCADTLFMIAFAIAFLLNPLSCVLWVLIHLVGVGLLYKAFRSGQQLERRSRRRRPVQQVGALQ